MGWFCKEKDSEEYVEADATKITETGDNLYVAEYDDNGEMINKPIIDKYKAQIEDYQMRISDYQKRLEERTQHEAELVERIGTLTKQLNEVNSLESRVVSRDEALDLYNKGERVVGLINNNKKPMSGMERHSSNYSKWSAQGFGGLTGKDIYSSYVTFVCIGGDN